MPDKESSLHSRQKAFIKEFIQVRKHSFQPPYQLFQALTYLVIIIHIILYGINITTLNRLEFSLVRYIHLILSIY